MFLANMFVHAKIAAYGIKKQQETPPASATKPNKR